MRSKIAGVLNEYKILFLIIAIVVVMVLRTTYFVSFENLITSSPRSPSRG